MAFDVTLGQYYGTNSVIHKMDPRSKLLFVLFFIVSIFVAKDVYSFALLFGIAIFSVIGSKVPIRVVLKGLKPLIFIIDIKAPNEIRHSLIFFILTIVNFLFHF